MLSDMTHTGVKGYSCS